MTTPDLVELLTVTDRFELQGRGLVVTPHLDPPVDGWKASTRPVVIVAPDGQSSTTEAQLELWHFNIPDHELAAQSGFALVILFPTLIKADVPIGSRILVPRSLWNETR
jgi:hypothetical protein